MPFQSRWADFQCLLVVVYVSPTGRIRHMAFVEDNPSAGRSSDTPSISQNSSGPVGIPLKRSTSGKKNLSSPVWVRVYGTAPWGSRRPSLITRHLNAGFPVSMSGGLDQHDEAQRPSHLNQSEQRKIRPECDSICEARSLPSSKCWLFNGNSVGSSLETDDSIILPFGSIWQLHK